MDGSFPVSLSFIFVYSMQQVVRKDILQMMEWNGEPLVSVPSKKGRELVNVLLSSAARHASLK